ncbi:ATP-binding protein [Saccharopolyspora pogona]|uniref:ATP-binding protein n=1 Tax=Saccharopolyspora pogona TaxID=333966 RepID=UPI001CC24775|nr:LuxR C-terminal-related transcriptional regulator [Saccharopolyspora pogona]
MGNIPVDTTSFVGRSRELSEAKSMLARSRLVTLIGVGGVGKTRLALRVAASLPRAFPDGVWLVDLTKMSGPQLLTRTVAEAVEIRESSRRNPLVVLAEHFRDRRALLVLDNCESMSQECAGMANALLKEAPKLRILATSRQRLNIAAEALMDVPPLSEGVTLFVERAKAVRADFRLDDRNRTAVEGICRRLDGLPLAIELAAARTRTLSLDEILARLDDPYHLLDVASAGGEPRHQTLRALIDWSHGLCTPAERQVWVRTSVFAGAFDLEAAEAVCRDEDLLAEDVVDAVAGLIDKSILHRELHGNISRYRQIDTIRAYGRERLADSGAEPAIALRHRQYYQRVGARTAVERFGPNQVEWFARLRLDHADLRAALERCAADPGAASDGLRLAADLMYHWVGSYYLNEGRGWLDEFLALATEPTMVRVDALWVNGWLALIQSDLTAARSMLAEARTLATRLGAEPALGYVALYSGMVASLSDDTATALELYDEALRRHRASGNQHGIATALIRTAMAHSRLGNSDRASALAEECLAVCDAVGDIWHKSYALTALGIEMWRQGDAERAAELEGESLRLNRDLDDRMGIVLNLDVLALAAASGGDHRRAARLFGAQQALRRSLGVSLHTYTHFAAQHEECVQQLRADLGERAYHSLVQEGTELTLDEAVALAVAEKPRSTTRSASGGPALLTRRESQVAELIARGMTNKEIAAELVIAVRTAESHVEHIFAKLDVTSRAQVATWITEHARASED